MDPLLVRHRLYWLLVHLDGVRTEWVERRVCVELDGIVELCPFCDS